MNYNPNDYETVKSRKEKFYKDYKDGRITCKLHTIDKIMEYAVFEARVYLNVEDQKNQCPRGIGYATEIRNKEKSISNKGSKYESVNFTSWTENAEESAVGRALDNAGYSGNKKCSREEIEKAQRMAKLPDDKDNEFKNSICPKCGGRIAISKNSKPYCTNACWLPKNQHFIDEYNQTKISISKDEGSNLSPLEDN
jgi:ribosomal protein S27AE